MIDTLDPSPQDASPTPEDDPFADQRDATPWLKLIKDAETVFQTYHQKVDSIEKLYADLKTLAGEATEREMQIFWANLEVLKPSIYARPPIPVVTARFKKRGELQRQAADMLERSLITSFDMENMDSTMKALRDDLAIIGRGASWLRLEQDDEGERVCYDHIERRDFLHDPARKWREIGWVGRREWLTKEKGLARFGAIFAQATPVKRKNDNRVDDDENETVPVWEVWHKEKQQVIWVSPSVDEVLDIQPPFLDLQGFFPCPRPAYGTLQRGTLIPVPDFIYYKDQIEEINELTARIAALAQALKMKGFYAAGNGDIADAIQTALKARDNTAIMVPVPNMAAMGGASLKDSVVWLPVVEIANTVTELLNLRKELIQDVYQVTGLSDIMRGATNAQETLGAQQLKSQYGNIRIRDRQEELIRIARDMTEMSAEIMAENFSPKTLLQYSQIDDLLPAQELTGKMQQLQGQIQQIQQAGQQAQQNPQIMQMAQQNPQQAQQIVQQAQQALQQAQQQLKDLQGKVPLEAVLQLIKSEKVRPFVLDIETNSTIQPDEQADKAARVEFLTAVGGFIQQAGPMVAAKPQTAPFVAEMLKYVASGYRAGRAMDQAIDEFAEQIKKEGQIAANQPPPPNPEQIKAQIADKQLQADMQKHKDTMTLETQKLTGEMGIKAKELALKENEISLRATDALHQHMTQQAATSHQQGMDNAHLGMEQQGQQHQQEQDAMKLELDGIAKALDQLLKLAQAQQPQQGSLQ